MARVNSVPQSGVLMPGAGANRLSSLLAELPHLSLEQQNVVNRAKKYALEYTMRCVLSKQTPVNNVQIHQNTIQRHQALVLMCRVYVGSISFEVNEDAIKNVFSPFGAVKSINMSRDPLTKKHKGFAFVEYELPEAAQIALEHMNGVQVGGRQIKVGRPSNIPRDAPVILQAQEECRIKNRIYVTNVHPDLFEAEVATIFDPFGRVRSCKLAMTPDVDKPQHRGYGFIEFDSDSATSEALTMENCDLGGQTIHVCRATTPAECMSAYGTLDPETTQLVNTNQPHDNTSENITPDKIDLDPSHLPYQNGGSSITECQHDRLTGCENMNQILEQGVSNGVIVLRSMIGQDEVIDDSLHLDIYEECTKYGQITQLLIYKYDSHQKELDGQNNSHDDAPEDVRVFVKYRSRSDSARAIDALDKRFFAGRRISAEHYDSNAFRMCDYSK